MKSKAVLFGLNYVRGPPSNRLRGCINDVNNMGKYLSENGNYDCVKIYTDETDDTRTNAHSMISTLHTLAMDSHRYNLEKVWIHFSGHGCQIGDDNCEEEDGKDECIVPTDCHVNGVIRDDLIKRILTLFNENTKVFCVFDCCHSGTIGDLKYLYKDKEEEPEECCKNSRCKANICMISGCMDSQTSADAFNVRNKRKFSGAMTSCLLETFKTNKKVFDVIKNLRVLLKRKRFTQYPQLTSSFKVSQEDVFM
jgi:hypothetical protein